MRYLPLLAALYFTGAQTTGTCAEPLFRRFRWYHRGVKTGK